MTDKQECGRNVASHKHWSMDTALEQIRKCAFECEGGPLANNVAWQWLEGAAKVGPLFWPGQGVWYLVPAKSVTGKDLSAYEHFYIVGCEMSSDNERRLWTYILSQDPPAPYHYGTFHFRNVPENDLRLENPEYDHLGDTE